MSTAVRIASTKKPAKYALIFLHGLGDTGQGWSFLAHYLQQYHPCFESTSFIFPNAPIKPVTANGGMPMPSWFDIKVWDWTTSNVDTVGFQQSLKEVQKYVDSSISDGIEPQNIIVGGFSQGAALALASAVTLNNKIGAFIGLSGFAYLRNELQETRKNLNPNTPVFHGHGESDDVVPFPIGVQTAEFFKSAGELENYTFKSYRGLGHSADPAELNDLAEFLKSNVYSKDA
ncbi:Acyl-protein thioesterase 1 [Nakaseomyces glabratus]|nr:Acyl-protein thioesterase 1 [Nakaseomyces glabratus]KTB26838.1 Acyl-protein thioesterase 1 [Nakaseomyces glabratus]